MPQVLPSARTSGRRGFGVGCFHFRPRKEGPYRLGIKEYVDGLRTALQRVTTINNIEIEYRDPNAAFGVPEGPSPSLEDGSGIVPHPSGMEIRFDVYIPFRIQREVSRENVERETSTEHFRVLIEYTFHTPVAFIESLNAHGEYRPSTAVQVVREYLRRELNIPASDVVFECLGPSPFHAEFYLESTSELSEGGLFTVKHLRTRGYADVVFGYDASAFHTFDAALLTLWYDISDELGLFYELHLTDVAAYQTWEAFQGSVLALTETPSGQSFVSRVRASWNRGKEIHELHTDLVRFEVNQLHESHRLQRFFRSTYSTDEPTYLRTFLDEEMKERPMFPTQQIGQLIGFLEERRSKAVELAIVLVAAIVGGIAGSVLTLIVQQ